MLPMHYGTPEGCVRVALRSSRQRNGGPEVACTVRDGSRSNRCIAYRRNRDSSRRSASRSARKHKQATSPDSAAAARKRGDARKERLVEASPGFRTGRKPDLHTTLGNDCEPVGRLAHQHPRVHALSFGECRRYANGAVVRFASKRRTIPRGLHTPDTPESSRHAHARAAAPPDRH
ncbi:hypothetical protein C5615_20030 [Burkholderia cepacia]|uniref:Uncharacterized protein n=1 Tax=Burkholderia cepacia TaxID=292 RepID=A0A2S8INL6_BURCE|nr:hypothetical protein C5615_20030 [Burkholderia cepacia]